MPDPARDRRVHPRERRRLSCELRLDPDGDGSGKKTLTGVVLDLSAQGLFVRTNGVAAPGSAVTVVIRRAGGEVWQIAARVARHVPRPGSAPSRRGLGLEIVEAPESYHAFVAALPARSPRSRAS